jgi:hypothetical protein
MAKQISDNWHLSLSLGKSLWDDLVDAALPVTVSKGSFELRSLVKQGVKQLQVKERVVALLEDEQTPAALVRAKDRAAGLWRNRREQVYQALHDLIQIEGDWQIQIDREGTEFHYAEQRIGVDAHARAVLHGKARLLRENLELPFTLEKRLGATCHLGNIHFDRNQRAITGEILDPSIDFGDHVIFQLLNEASKRLLEQQLHRFNPIPLLKKDQIDEMVSPAGGPLKMKMSVDDIALEVTSNDMTLKVRFGFSQLQLPGE